MIRSLSYVIFISIFLYTVVVNIKNTIIDPIIDRKAKKDPNNYIEGKYIRPPYQIFKILGISVLIITLGITFGVIITNLVN